MQKIFERNILKHNKGMQEDAKMFLGAIVFLVVIFVAVIIYMVTRPQGFQVSGGTPGGQVNTSSTLTNLPSIVVECSGVNQQTNGIRLKNTLSPGVANYMNGTGRYYIDGTGDYALTPNSSTTYETWISDCGKPIKYVNIGRTASAGSGQGEWSAHKGTVSNELSLPALWHQIKVQLFNGASNVQWLAFPNNTTNEITTTSGIDNVYISPDTANSSHNVSAGSTWKGKLLLASSNSTAGIGDISLVTYLVADYGDIDEDGVALVTDGGTISQKYLDNGLGDAIGAEQAGWLKSKYTEELTMWKVNPVTSQRGFTLTVPTVNPFAGSLQDWQWCFAGEGYYRGTGKYAAQIRQGVVDDSSSTNFVGQNFCFQINT